MQGTRCEPTPTKLARVENTADGLGPISGVILKLSLKFRGDRKCNDILRLRSLLDFVIHFRVAAKNPRANREFSRVRRLLVWRIAISAIARSLLGIVPFSPQRFQFLSPYSFKQDFSRFSSAPYLKSQENLKFWGGICQNYRIFLTNCNRRIRQ
jgi:hypothetical protein